MFTNIKQIVPQKACLSCDVCCRYIERKTPLVPCFLADEAKSLKRSGHDLDMVGEMIDLKMPPIPYKDYYICSFFNAEKNTCNIYPSRPLDCKIYPFMVTYSQDYKSVILALDTKCPYLKDKAGSEEFNSCLNYLADILEENNAIEELNNNKIFINDFQQDCITLKRLNKISQRLCLQGFGLKRISLDDKGIFKEYFARQNFFASCFSFAAIYAWSDILNILWKEINDTLCIFAGNSKNYFLLLPPVTEKFNKDAVKESFDILSDINGSNKGVARIENIPQELYSEATSSGLVFQPATVEYIYKRADLIELKGDQFKSKRSAINYFTKNYKHKYRPFEEDDIFNCLVLYREWARHRLSRRDDDYYRLLMEDSYISQKKALMNFKALDMRGFVVEIDGKIEGYTLGYPLNENIFVVLFEITNPNIKGLPQFIFKNFLSSLNNAYINTLSDSGLENLKRTKESYRPLKKINLFIARP